MYPLCCIDIRNFLNQFYFFANDDFSHTDVIDDTLKDVGILAWCLSSQLTTPGLGWTSIEQSMRHTCWASRFPVFGPDCPNPHKLRAFWTCLSWTWDAACCCKVTKLCWRFNRFESDWKIQNKQESRREAYIWGRQLQDRWSHWDRRIRLDGACLSYGAQQLHANPDPVSV